MSSSAKLPAAPIRSLDHERGSSCRLRNVGWRRGMRSVAPRSFACLLCERCAAAGLFSHRCDDGSSLEGRKVQAEVLVVEASDDDLHWFASDGCSCCYVYRAAVAMMIASPQSRVELDGFTRAHELAGGTELYPRPTMLVTTTRNNPYKYTKAPAPDTWHMSSRTRALSLRRQHWYSQRKPPQLQRS